MSINLQNTYTALTHILRTYKITPTATNAVEECENLSELLEYFLGSNGVMYLSKRKTEVDFKRSSDLMLAFSADNEPVIIRPGVVGNTIYSFSNEKLFRLSKDKILEMQDEVFVICRPITSANFSVKNIAKFIFTLLTVKDVLPITAMILLISLLGLAVPALYKQILYNIVPMGATSDAVNLLVTAALIYLTCIITRTIVTRFKIYSLNTLKLRISAQIQNAIMARVLLMDQTYFANTSAGKLSTNLNYAQQLSEKIMNLIVDSSLTTIFSLIYIPQMIILGPTMWLPCLVVYGAEFAVSLAITKAKVKNETDKTESYLKTNNFSYLILQGIQKIKTSGQKRRITSKWIDNFTRQLQFSTNPPLCIKLDAVIDTAISGLATLTVLIFAYFTDVDKASYMTFCSSMYLVSSAISALQNTITSTWTMKPLLLRVQKILSTSPQKFKNQHFLHELKGAVKVENLSFSYGGKIKCLDGINLEILPGQKVAIVGMSGSGKSTLLDLLLGIRTPDSGHIYYDGADISNLDVRSVRRQIATVLQYSKLIPGTVAENVAYGSKTSSNDQQDDETIKKVEEAVEAACLQDDVSSWNLGLDTQISDSAAAGISGGQRQRILLARAVAQSKNLMILDEATSSLDNATQARVLDNIYKLPCSVLMVAHRISTIQNCDKIYVINDGKIVEQGTYDELMNADSFFKSFAANQTSAEQL